MKNTDQQTSITDKVLEKIDRGEVKMRSRKYFVLRSVVIGLSIIVMVLFTLYLLSFIAFALRINGVWLAPGFGLPGLGIFFGSLPWILIGVSLVLLVTIEILVKRLSFAWRRPMAYSLMGIILLALFGSFFLDKTGMHSALFVRAREGHLPIAGSFYREHGAPRFRGIHPGIVKEMTENGFLLETRREEIIIVIISEKTKISTEVGMVRVEDMVIVYGARTNGTVHAFGIRKVGGEMKERMRPQRSRK